jgi:two-component system sensor histidine kinase/response regulator
VTDESPISEKALERTLELDRIRGGGVFARVVRAFLTEAPATLADLRTAARKGDAAGMARSAHALRSASLNVGAESMATLCKEVESLGKNGNAEDAAASASATRLDELYPAVKTSLEDRLERHHHDDVVSA